MSTTWFVGADWLAEHIDDPEIQIIDARMASPGQEDRNVAQEYLNGHIPGAVFFDIEALSDHTSPLPHMLPRPETFAVAMRELGVNQDKHLIVYDEGDAPRDKRTYFREINYIAAAFQYQKKNYNSA